MYRLGDITTKAEDFTYSDDSFANDENYGKYGKSMESPLNEWKPENDMDVKDVNINGENSSHDQLEDGVLIDDITAFNTPEELMNDEVASMRHHPVASSTRSGDFLFENINASKYF